MSHSTAVKSVPIVDWDAVRKTVAELNEKGIRCSLLEKAAPRMYYLDQLQKQLGQKTEICDYVLKLEDAP